MIDSVDKINILQDAGDIATQLLHTGFPTPSPDCPSDEEGHPILEGDDRYWNYIDQIEVCLSRFGEVERHENMRGINAGATLAASRNVGDGWTCSLRAMPGLHGNGAITLEYMLNNSWQTAIDHSYSELTMVDIGRYIAKAELSILANELGSNAETLDYWMVEEADYRDPEWDQSRWAEVRGVSRQTVNQRVRDARQKLSNKN